jgi:hypothetical protein
LIIYKVLFLKFTNNLTFVNILLSGSSTIDITAKENGIHKRLVCPIPKGPEIEIVGKTYHSTIAKHGNAHCCRAF